MWNFENVSLSKKCSSECKYTFCFDQNLCMHLIWMKEKVYFGSWKGIQTAIGKKPPIFPTV